MLVRNINEVTLNKLFALKLDVETEDKKFGIAQVVENSNCTGLIGDIGTLFPSKHKCDTYVRQYKMSKISWSNTGWHSRYDSGTVNGNLKHLAS